MKPILLLMMTILAPASSPLFAQSYSASPVRWEYSVKKVSKDTYELHLTALIVPEWHIYAQRQPENAIGVPTAISFRPDSAVILEGKPQEIGNMEKYENQAVGIADWQYENKVDFVQTARVKKEAPVWVKGNIIYQACRKDECLKPVTVAFSLELNASPQ
jgi:hypothetical protein